MRGRTICVLADAAAMPMQGFLQHFKGEFEKKIHDAALVEKGRTFRDEMTATAKKITRTDNAPSVIEVGMGKDRT
jgi:hypothetical protein